MTVHFHSVLRNEVTRSKRQFGEACPYYNPNID